jgi:purine-binding chemotaxis protein CheW
MADARKRAKRGAEPPAEEPKPAREPEADADDPVFADEPEAGAAQQGEQQQLRADRDSLPGSERGGAGGAAQHPPQQVSLPASGLAEDILKSFERTPLAEPAAEEAPDSAEPLALPASGLAEEVLGREQTLSFFSAPAQQQRAAAEATEHLASFYLDREEYGVDVRQVQEIRRVTEITSVPRAPRFIRGVINLRGRILPVLDLRTRLGLGEVATSRAARIVVVRVKDRLLGLLVDGASQVLKIPVSQVEPAPEEVVQKGGDYIRGVAKLDDRLIILVDLERLLAYELAADAAPTLTVRAAGVEDGASQE